MIRFTLFLLVIIGILFACQTAPRTIEEQQETIEIIEVTEEPAEEPCPFAASQELYDQTLAEIRLFIENLNRIINARNFNAWRSALTEERFELISSAQFLAAQSESPALSSRRPPIVLRTANDYFTNVVVPSRANSRVDEIEFIDDHTIRVFFLETRTRTENNERITETRRLQLYQLIKNGNEWKISS